MPSAASSRCRIESLSSRLKAVRLRPFSMRSWIQDFCSGYWMCMNSTPMVEQ